MSRAPAGDGRALLPVEVVVPLRWDGVADSVHHQQVAGMTRYLRALSHLADVTVVDGTRGARGAAQRAAWSPWVRVLVPAVPGPGPRNGKVVGALTGVRAARHELVVVADDDVRYDPGTLTAVVDALEGADLVRPQNVWATWPWHARWDFARSCLARAVGHDWPGTFGLRRSTVVAMGGWADDVLFENLELVRSVQAAGGRVRDLDDVAVRRLPPTTAQFLGQRVRQAYDELARPWWLVPALLVWPGVAVAAARARWALPVAAVVVVGVAERGRRRPGTRDVPVDVPLWVVPWALERGLCAWVALLHRALGGMPYCGSRLPLAVRTPPVRGPNLRVASRTPGITVTDVGTSGLDSTTTRTEMQEVVP